jgi:hypothetical protein
VLAGCARYPRNKRPIGNIDNAPDKSYLQLHSICAVAAATVHLRFPFFVLANPFLRAGSDAGKEIEPLINADERRLIRGFVFPGTRYQAHWQHRQPNR